MLNFLTPKQLSALIQVSEKTLASQRSAKRGIPYVKVGKAVRYRMSEVETYFNQMTELVLTQQNKGE